MYVRTLLILYFPFSFDSITLQKFYVWEDVPNYFIYYVLLLEILNFYSGQDDDAVNAETFIKKASFLVNNGKDEGLNLQYKVFKQTWFCYCT